MGNFRKIVVCTKPMPVIPKTDQSKTLTPTPPAPSEKVPIQPQTGPILAHALPMAASLPILRTYLGNIRPSSFFFFFGLDLLQVLIRTHALSADKCENIDLGVTARYFIYFVRSTWYSWLSPTTMLSYPGHAVLFRLSV
jgi:hypothetical protein